MAFNQSGFMKGQFSFREREVDVPSLAQWFKEGDKPTWRVRGLTAEEVASAGDSAEKKKDISSFLEKFMSGSAGDKAKAVKEQLGIHEDGHPEIYRRMELLVKGSIEPVVELELAEKMARIYPSTFMTLTNTILSLTGQGQEVVGKHTPSGDSQKSGA